MKKDYIYLLLIVAAIVIGLSIPVKTHICVDDTHQQCDSECVCDAMECK